MRKRLAVLAIALALLPLGVAAKGKGIDKPTYVYIPREETVSGNLYRAGETVQIDGAVDGDVIVAGGMIKINGAVTGDVLAIGGRVVINGPVQGDVRVIGGQIDLNGVIGKNLSAMGGNVTISKDGAIGYEAMMLAGNVDFEGQVKRDLRGMYGRLSLGGRVEHDVFVKADQLELLPTVQIAGNLTYASKQPADVMSGAVVKGEVNFQQAAVGKELDTERINRAAIGMFAGILLMKWMGMVLLALLIIRLFPKKLEKAMHEFKDGVWPVLGIGMLAMIGGPVAAMIVALTFIGLPIAVVLGALYVLVVLSGKVVIATYVGDWIIRQLTNRHFRSVSLAWSAVLGLTILMIVALVPVIGWLLAALSLAFGMGAIILFEQQELRRWR